MKSEENTENATKRREKSLKKYINCHKWTFLYPDFEKHKQTQTNKYLCFILIPGSVLHRIKSNGLWFHPMFGGVLVSTGWLKSGKRAEGPVGLFKKREQT